ncbi:MAG: cobalamin-dependent protein, partial [Patescibacteria group bacterium]
MLDVLLINPTLFKRESNIWQKIDSSFPSLGIASMAAYVRSKGYLVKIIDAPAEKISVEGFENYLKNNLENFRAKYVGFTATTAAIKNAYEMAKIIKEVYPETKIIFGGAHCAALPDEVISQSVVDLVVCGEGEITLYEI